MATDPAHWQRHPSVILAEMDKVALRAESPAYLRELLWEVITDVCDSWTLALESQGLNPINVQNALNEVDDYLANHYGDEFAVVL
jgi:hypothetical protein